MPLFEYVCQDCQHDCELLIRGGEVPECPECGSRRLEKQLSVPAAHTKGGGALPVCEVPRGGGCGAPACGMGGCQGGF